MPPYATRTRKTAVFQPGHDIALGAGQEPASQHVPARPRAHFRRVRRRASRGGGAAGTLTAALFRHHAESLDAESNGLDKIGRAHV